MKTSVPNEEKLNDASPPEGDDDSVDAEVGTPEPIEKVPGLPENCDEELSISSKKNSAVLLCY